MNATVAYGAFYDRNTSTYNYTDYKFFKFWFAFHQTVHYLILSKITFFISA